MNFISETWESLTFGGKIYILFQMLYFAFGAFFLYVQWHILVTLKILNRKRQRARNPRRYVRPLNRDTLKE
jgi:hypothetical protein